MKINFLRNEIIYFFNIINFLPKNQNGEIYLSIEKESNIYFYNKNVKIQYKIKSSFVKKKIIVNFKYESLSKIIKTINNMNVSLLFNNKKIFFKNKNFSLLLLSKLSKKTTSIKESNYVIILNNKDIIEALKTIIIVFKGENILNGIYFKINKECIEIISCDNFRFSFNKIKLSQSIKIKKKFYIKEVYIKFLIKILNKDKKTKVYIKKNSIIFFVNENIKIEVKIYKDDNFNYDSILKLNNNEILAKVFQKDFSMALKRAKLLCSNKNRCVCIKIDSEYIKVSSNNLDKEIFAEKIKNHVKPFKSKRLYFNIDYLIDFICIVKNYIRILFNKKKKIVLFELSNDCKYMLMPIETNF